MNANLREIKRNRTSPQECLHVPPGLRVPRFENHCPNVRRKASKGGHLIHGLRALSAVGLDLALILEAARKSCAAYPADKSIIELDGT